MSQLTPNTTPIRTFEDHEETVRAVTVFPNKRRMITGSWDKTLRLWDLETGVVLKKMEGHSSDVQALAVSRDGQIIASGDQNGEIIAWHGETGDFLTQPIEAHSSDINSLDLSPDGTVLATGSNDKTTKFWCTKTWQMQGEPIECGNHVCCLRYSPCGELLAIATFQTIHIYNPGTRKRVASFNGHTDWNLSLTWTPDGKRLLSAGDQNDPTIREWDPLTWQQVGHPWQGHTENIYAIAIHPSGTLVASISADNQVRLWRLSDRRTIAIFQHSSSPISVTFSSDGNHILSGGYDNKVSEWAVPRNASSKILAITAAHDACVTGDLFIAEQSLTQDIHTDANDYTSYAHRSFILARKHAWNLALDDAIKSISIRPSLTGYISKGIALCGKGHLREARIAFDAASMFTNQDSEANHFLLLIKAIALFSADQHEEAMLLIKELAAACPNTDPLARRVVETYLRVQLGINALDGARYDEAADHFTIAVNSTAFSSKFIHLIYEELTVLFGWDLESLCLTAHQKRCQAFLLAGKLDEALEAHKHMVDVIDESAKASYLDWSNEFKEQCNALAEQNGPVLGVDIPGQEQDGYDMEPSFFHGVYQHSQPQPQQRPGGLKGLRRAMTSTSRSVPSPAPAPTPSLPTPSLPTPSPSAIAPTAITARLGNLFSWRSHHAGPRVINVPFARDLQRYAATGVPGSDDSLICDHGPTPDPDLQQQQAVAVQVDPGEHGGGRSCWCC